MSAETALNTALLAAPAVTAIVGSGSAARVYPDVVPQDKGLPALAYARVATEPILTVHSAAPIATRATLEVWCMAATRAAAEGLADIVSGVVGAARFIYAGRRFEYDPDNELFAAVLTVDYFS
jgi:hypothetical protein